MNGKSNPNKERRKTRKKQKKKLSTREIEDLMRMNRPCIERRCGVLRQK